MILHQPLLPHSAIRIALCLFLPLTGNAAPPIDLPTLPLNYCANSVHQNPPTIPDQSTDQGQASDAVYGYQSAFDSSDWSGLLTQFSVSKKEDSSLTVATQPRWEAGSRLSKTSAPTQRHIATYNRATQTTMPFIYDQLPADIQAIFNHFPNSDQQDNLGAARVNYLAGDRSPESARANQSTSKFKLRKHILGDIVHSNLVVKGPPTKEISDADYLPFFRQFEHRAAAIYVGANDGMLHAFSVETGDELFAYIPSPLLETLPALTDPASQHAFYMDGKINVDEAKVRNAWKTVITAGMGAGAKGIFALDVSSPAALPREGGVLFEFTGQDDPDMGYVTSAPLITKIKTGTQADGSDSFAYFIVTPGGYNSSNPDGGNVLFLISLDKPEHTPWALNKNYFKLKATGKPGTANALSSPALVLNSNRAALFAYAGDLQGNVWRFDFSAAGGLASSTATLLFSAVDPDNHAQPITAQPTIVHAPAAGNLIIFGTGKYLEDADTRPENYLTNSFYAIYDGTSNGKSDDPIKSRNELAKRTLNSTNQNGVNGFDVTGADFSFTAEAENTKKGWYFDLPNSRQSGERSISEAVAAFGNVFFNTFIPDATSCQRAGVSVSYKLDALSGKTATAHSITGFKSPNVNLGAPSLILTGIHSGDRTATGKRFGTQFYTVVNFGNGLPGKSPIMTSDEVAEIISGRLSWREIQNWQELK